MKIVEVQNPSDFQINLNFDTGDLVIIEIMIIDHKSYLNSLTIESDSIKTKLAIKAIRYLYENYSPIQINYQIKLDPNFNPNFNSVGDINIFIDFYFDDIYIGDVRITAYYDGILHIYELESFPKKIGLGSQALKYLKSNFNISREF